MTSAVAPPEGAAGDASSSATAGGPAGAVWRRVMAVMGRVPFTMSVLVVMVFVGLLTGALWQPINASPWWDWLAYGLPSFEQGRWWTVVTGSLLATIPVQYLAVGLGFGVLVGFAELRLGTRLTVIATVTGQVVGVLGAALVLWACRGLDWTWAATLRTDLDVGFSAGAVCAITVTAYALHAPWRGRLLFVIVGYCTVNLLFVGLLWDLEHLFAVATGIVIGHAVHAHRETGVGLRMSRREWRLFAAGLVLLLAVSQLIALVYPTDGPLGTDEYVPLHRVPVLVFAILQLPLASGLARGSRMAWRIGLGFAAVGFVSSGLLAPARLVVGVLAYGALALVLVLGQHAFTALPERLAVTAVLRSLVVMVLGLLLYGWLGYEVFDFAPEPTPSQALDEWANRLFFSTTGEFEGTTRPAQVFLDSLSFTWLVALVWLLFLVVRRTRRTPESADRDVAVALLHEHGGGNLSWMSLWPANAHFVTADRRATVAYQVHQGVAIALGDPIGAPDARDTAVLEFARWCEESGLLPCLFSCSEAVLPQVRQLRWRSAQVAEDTVIDLPGLAFKGKAWQDVRTAMNRARKAGIDFRLGKLADEPFTVVEQVRGISEQWVGDKGLPEMGFTLGGVDEALDPEVRVGLAVGADGVVQGVTSWLPVYGPGGVARGWTLDVMRRRPDGFRAVIEFLIAESCLAFQAQGATTVSLSGAPLARADDTEPETQVDELLDRLGAVLEPYYGFRSLHQFKLKFQPRFEPMYLCFTDEAALPRLGVALTKAYLPGIGLRDLPALVRSGR